MELPTLPSEIRNQTLSHAIFRFALGGIAGKLPSIPP